MQRITIEKLGSGLLARLFRQRPPAGVVRLRVWFDNEEGIPASVAEMVRVLSHAGTVSLEFWDESKSVLEALRSLNLTATRADPAAHLALFDTSIQGLAPILDRLSFASFGGWLGVGTESLERILTSQRDQDRMRAMPGGAIMIVFSLYDGNIELVAKGFDEDVLTSKLQTAAIRVAA